ncbi:MAG: plasmid stabilization protein [Proteobacteria bacterium]|nr:MAG: plasmid stabilization protein [Pseudomonadota bacterium]
MKFIFSDEFHESLDAIEDFIGQDSPNRALNFTHNLWRKIETIPFMPYRFRKKQNFNDENIRDLIYKGHTIPFEIREDIIIILDIYNHNIKSRFANSTD